MVSSGGREISRTAEIIGVLELNFAYKLRLELEETDAPEAYRGVFTFS